MKRTLLSLLMAFALLLTACGGRSPETSSSENEPSVSEEVSSQENEKEEATSSSEKEETSSESSPEPVESQQPGQLSIAAPKGPKIGRASCRERV